MRNDYHEIIIFNADTSFLRTLDSSIKRNTAVIRKLKQISEDQKESLIEELKSVNLSKFVSEAVSYICEAKLKTSDIQTAVQVKLNLHLTVQVFQNTPLLLSCLLKKHQLFGGSCEECNNKHEHRVLGKKNVQADHCALISNNAICTRLDFTYDRLMISY